MKQVLYGPAITEKSMSQVTDGKYTFRVNPNANKHEIAAAVKKLYKVDPIQVRVINLKGKKFGEWKVIKYVGGKYNKWRCKCDCGNVCDVIGHSLRQGTSTRCRSCGNKNATGSIKHGFFRLFTQEW